MTVELCRESEANPRPKSRMIIFRAGRVGSETDGRPGWGLGPARAGPRPCYDKNHRAPAQSPRATRPAPPGPPAVNPAQGPSSPHRTPPRTRSGKANPQPEQKCRRSTGRSPPRAITDCPTPSDVRSIDCVSAPVASLTKSMTRSPFVLLVPVSANSPVVGSYHNSSVLETGRSARSSRSRSGQARWPAPSRCCIPPSGCRSRRYRCPKTSSW